jgi:hypothetical protein
MSRPPLPIEDPPSSAGGKRKTGFLVLSTSQASIVAFTLAFDKESSHKYPRTTTPVVASQIHSAQPRKRQGHDDV